MLLYLQHYMFHCAFRRTGYKQQFLVNMYHLLLYPRNPSTCPYIHPYNPCIHLCIHPYNPCIHPYNPRIHPYNTCIHHYNPCTRHS